MVEGLRPLANRSRKVKKLPSDFDIFSPSMIRCSACSQMRTNLCPVAPSLCAISFSWCGKARSTPPVWMSRVSPRYFMAMVEHSICQPGRPGPMRVSQKCSPGFGAFHRAKSRAFSVVRKLGDAEIDGAVASIGKTLGGEALDQRDHVFDVVRSAHQFFGHF